MNTTIPCWLLIFVLSSGTAADATAGDCFAECLKTQCGESGPEIRYPFRKVEQNSTCGIPGFDLKCTADNRTILHLPNDDHFYVQSIDYNYRILQIVDPQGCLLNRTAHFNLSSSPFNSWGLFADDATTTFSIFNCSSSIDTYMVQYPYFYKRMNCCETSISQIFSFPSDESIDGVPPFCQRLEKTTRLDIGIYHVGDHVCIFQELFTLGWEIPRNFWPCKEEKGLTTAAIIGITATVIFSAALAVAFYYWDPKFGGYWEPDQYEVEKFLDSYQSLNPKRYSYSDLKRITNHFGQKIGEGGFGSVYMGRMPNGIPVAVKTLLVTSRSNGDEFLNEVATIGRVHHLNVVRLLGFCAERSKRALVYEFMPNGSLEKFIFSSESKPCDLGWDKLHEIAVGIARGIEYLHQGCHQRILHFDIKPHNILLDHRFTPKISDFGLAKFCSKDQSIVSMTAARGTVGYIAPEVVSRNFGNISYKSDVYSFGMLLLEMVGRRKNIDMNVEQTSQVYFPEWIYNRVNLQLDLGAGEVLNAEEDEIARKLVTVALWCIQLNPVDRPNMKKVVHMLKGEIKMPEFTPNPFISSTASPLVSNVSG
ncbi:unnamed protein product [Victoria cruziana]